MTAAAAVALVVAAAFAVADWAAVARDARRLEYVCKPATLAALLAAAALLTPADPARRTWVLVALALSLLGDVFLMLPSDRFVPGLAAFLGAHVAYIVAFRLGGPSMTALLVALAVVLAVGALPASRILAALAAAGQGALRPPVVVYMLAISVMVAAAVASGSAWAGAGAALFYVSDLVLAWNRFVRPLPSGSLAVIVTYHVGQAALVLSLLR